jgi:Fur family peroxide stress response transcriptional regulator
MALSAHQREHLKESLHRVGLKPTRQREHVFSVLLTKRDHPTVEEVWQRARTGFDGISLATVYNCLESFVRCGVVRQVNYEREPTRYCPNLAPHAHFKDAATGRVYDIDLPDPVLETLRRLLPSEFEPEAIEISFHGKKARASR